MANSNEITRYKQQLMSLIIGNEKIVNLINEAEVTEENAEDLINSNIFNYIRIPDAPEEEKTYICIEVDIPNMRYSSSNKLFKELILTVYIITHERLMSTIEGGTRTDLISAELDTMLTGYKGIGFTAIECVSNVSNGIGVKHRCRIMTFATQDLIKSECG